MTRLREWHNPEIHLPHGTVAFFETRSHHPFLTNAKPERVSSVKATHLANVTITLEGETFVPTLNPVSSHVLRVCGFDIRDKPDQKVVPMSGKFVFHKDGTFFLAADCIQHIDLPASISVYDPVAILSAGFITLSPEKVVLHGESIGLRKGPYFGTPFDRQAISIYFGIPFVLTEDEFID
jgi:hypothetical protein